MEHGEGGLFMLFHEKGSEWWLHRVRVFVAVQIHDPSPRHYGCGVRPQDGRLQVSGGGQAGPWELQDWTHKGTFGTCVSPTLLYQLDKQCW